MSRSVLLWCWGAVSCGLFASGCSSSDDRASGAAGAGATFGAAGGNVNASGDSGLPRAGTSGTSMAGAGDAGSVSTAGSSAGDLGGSAAGGAGTAGSAAGGAAGAGGVVSTNGGAGAGGAGGRAGGGGETAGPLAARPFMGWSSWSSMTNSVNEAKVKAAADNVAANLASVGYRYINIDDGWQNGFDEYGRWKPDTNKFTGGMKGMADYVHSKGLKFGIYLTPGVNDIAVTANSAVEGTSYHVKDIVTSAAGNTNKKPGASARKIDFTKPGAVEYVQGHAKLLASWGVDFIKMDFVGPGGGGGSADNREDIKQWRAALDKSGRQIWLELSNMLDIGAISTWKAASNGWRVANDVECYCSTLTNWAHVARVINALPPFVQYAGPGGWNDLDSLEIGNGNRNGLTADERQTMFSFWAINAAPLYLGSDATVALDPADLMILTNKEVIAVDQAGIAAKPLSTGNTQVWYSKPADGSVVVGLFNFGAGASNVSVSFASVGAGTSMNVRDLAALRDLGKSSGSFSAMLPAHGSRLIRLTQ